MGGSGRADPVRAAVATGGLPRRGGRGRSRGRVSGRGGGGLTCGRVLWGPAGGPGAHAGWRGAPSPRASPGARRWGGLCVSRRVGRSVGLRPALVVVVTGRPVGRPVPTGLRVLLPSPGRRMAWSPEAFMSVVKMTEAVLRGRCSPRGGVHQRWGVVGVPRSPCSTSPLDQGPLTVG